jgi:hypothetical protein
MSRRRLANILIAAAATLLVASGILHLAVYGEIGALARSASPDDARLLLPALWVAIGIDLIVMGAVVAMVGIENSRGGRFVLFAAAALPAGSVVVHLLFLGFLAPTGLLMADAAVTLAAGVVREPRRRHHAP